MSQTAITPTRKENFTEWYQQVIKAAELAENSPVRGCMTIKPWGYKIWEQLQAYLDHKIKETGHDNAYFPLFIPLSFMQKEATHIEGFAKECAVITHHRLETKEGILQPAGPLEEPLIVRPTSEAIIGEAFSRWIQSYRDLPLKLNQWANVVRWEMRPRLFLRTAEILWQEGHTAHETALEAHEHAVKMLEVYRRLAEEQLAIPVIVGKKPPSERFAGAEETYTLEAMMQDGKALQLGTSHYLGQNFAKAFDIQYQTRAAHTEYAYTTSWGVTTRMIGAMIMVHGDDDGLRIPPLISPYHVVIIPFITEEAQKAEIEQRAQSLAKELSHINFENSPIRVYVDTREMRGGEKNWHWIKKGVPLRLEIGMRDLENQQFPICRRDEPHKKKQLISHGHLFSQIPQLLGQIQKNYYLQAQSYLHARTADNIASFEELQTLLNDEETTSTDRVGFIHCGWSGAKESEQVLATLKASIRCIPLEQEATKKCLLTTEPATCNVIIAKSY